MAPPPMSFFIDNYKKWNENLWHGEEKTHCVVLLFLYIYEKQAMARPVHLGGNRIE